MISTLTVHVLLIIIPHSDIFIQYYRYYLSLFIPIPFLSSEFVDTSLKNVAEKYSNVRFHVVHSQDKFFHPRLLGTFVNGRTQKIVLRNKTPEQVAMLIKRLHDRRGGIIGMKRWATPKSSTPSFQGKWAPEMTNVLKGSSL